MVHNDCLDGVGLDEKEKGRCDSIVFTFTDDSELKNDLIEFRPGVRMILNSYIRSPSHGVDRRGCDPCLLMPHPVQLYVFYSILLTPLAGVWHVCTIPYIQEWLSISLHHNHELWFVVNSINLYPILLSPVQWPMGSLGQALCAIHPKHTESLSQTIIWAFVYSLWMIFEWRGFSKLWRVVDGRESLIVRRIVHIHIILSFVTAYCHHLN